MGPWSWSMNPVRGEVTIPSKTDDVAIVAGGVRVASDIGHRLSRVGVRVGTQLFEGHLCRIVGDDFVAPGQHEHREFGVPVLLLSGDVRGDGGVRAGLAACPVPVVDERVHEGVAPVVVVVADS